jgi:hypothetical protein
MKKAIPIIIAAIIVIWFIIGLFIPCDKFVFLPIIGEQQKSSCICLGKKFEYQANPNATPGDYGTKCSGLAIFKPIK